jgi:signal-transduction protein with cAMP-binding, CBS, and nucleotidyltransferase domain
MMSEYVIPSLYVKSYLWAIANAELWKAMEQMSREDINEMPVMQGNTVVGMLSMADIVKYLQTMQQLRAT